MRLPATNAASASRSRRPAAAPVAPRFSPKGQRFEGRARSGRWNGRGGRGGQGDGRARRDGRSQRYGRRRKLGHRPVDHERGLPHHGLPHHRGRGLGAVGHRTGLGCLPMRQQREAADRRATPAADPVHPLGDATTRADGLHPTPEAEPPLALPLPVHREDVRRPAATRRRWSSEGSSSYRNARTAPRIPPGDANLRGSQHDDRQLLGKLLERERGQNVGQGFGSLGRVHVDAGGR